MDEDIITGRALQRPRSVSSLATKADIRVKVTETQQLPVQSANILGQNHLLRSSVDSGTEDDVEEFDDEDVTDSEEDETSEESESESGTATESSGEDWKPKKKATHATSTKKTTSKSSQHTLIVASPPVSKEDVKAAKAGKILSTGNSTKKISDLAVELGTLALSNEQAARMNSAGQSKRVTRSSTKGKASKAKQIADGEEESASDADDSAIIVPRKAAQQGPSKEADASKRKKRRVFPRLCVRVALTGYAAH